MTGPQAGRRGAHRPPDDQDDDHTGLTAALDEWSTRPLRGEMPPVLVRPAARVVTDVAPTGLRAATRVPQPLDDEVTGVLPALDPEPEPAPDAGVEPPPVRERRTRERGDLWRTVARGIGQTLVTAGLVVLLFVVYEVYVTDLFADQRQAAVQDELHDQWDNPTIAAAPGTPLAEVPLGDGFAFIRIPRLGEDYVRAIVEGTGTEELAQGPGHYVGTVMPGQVGNFAVAGHRVGTGSPFLDLDTMRPGDAIVVETVDSWYTYRVLGDPATGDFDTDPSGISGQEIVSPNQVDVISPTPDGTAADPATGAYLTLTTCNPKYSARQRLIIHAVLDGGPVLKTDAPDGPPALTGD